MARNIFRTLYILLLSLGLSACDKANEQSQLAIYVCDNPAAYSSISLYVDRLEVRTSGSENWTPIPVTESHIPLLTLVNGTMQEIGRTTLPEGTAYDAVRFTFLTENATVTAGGATNPLSIDDADATVTVSCPAFTMSGPNTPLLFDIDAATSVVEDASAADGYRFRPQISYVDTNNCGVVQGGLQIGTTAVTTPLLIRFTEQSTGTVSTTYCSTTTAGAFFKRLAPGSYTMEVVPAEDYGIAPYTTSITITGQQVTDLGTIILESTSL